MFISLYHNDTLVWNLIFRGNTINKFHNGLNIVQRQTLLIHNLILFMVKIDFSSLQSFDGKTVKENKRQQFLRSRLFYQCNFIMHFICFSFLAPPGYTLRLDFRDHFNIEPSEGCKFDYLEVSKYYVLFY